MSCHIHKVLQICDRHLFARSILSNTLIDHYKFGPIGELLKNNIHQEWIYSIVIKSEGSVFPYHAGESVTRNIGQDLREAFEYIKLLSNGQLPFGITLTNFEIGSKNVHVESNGELPKETYYFNPLTRTNLRSYMFVHPSHATQFFDQWQRQRKMWWRKFSASPGRFSLADIQNEDEGLTVQIQAQFPWGLESVETICHKGARPFDALDKADREIFEAKDGRRKVIPHVVESTVSLEGAVFTFLCDAYDEVVFLGMPREVMRFHRKLAPYKASFAASSSTTSVVGKELSHLAIYLTKQLRSAGISTLLLPDIAKKSLESQFVRNDELGIPYTVVLNDSTLKNGIIGLRSRDTTLKEQVHITDLKLYMERLLKNY